MANYLLDSDVLIWLLRGRRQTVDLVDELTDESAPACSALSRYEVEVGMHPSEAAATQQLFQNLEVLPVDSTIAAQAAQLVRQSKKRGKTIDPFDALIAATCLEHDLSLVTYSPKHFPMPKLRKYPAKTP